MLTVRFPNGQAVQYNTANYGTRMENYTDLYADSTKTKWIAQVSNTCIIESVPACRVYNAIETSEILNLQSELRAMKYQIKELKNILKPKTKKLKGR